MTAPNLDRQSQVVLHAKTQAPLQRQRLESIKTKFIVWYLALLFPSGSAAAISEADETIPKTPRRLLGAFNRTDAVAVPDAASAVPGRGLTPERSRGDGGAVLAEFRRKAEETRELHASSPGAGEGNCRRFVVIDTYHSDLMVSAAPRNALTFLSVVFRGISIRCSTLIGVSQISHVSRVSRGGSLTRTGGPHAHTPAPPAPLAAAATCNAGSSMRASSRQASTAELTSRGPLTASRIDRA
jgi:hypothetical protein